MLANYYICALIFYALPLFTAVSVVVFAICLARFIWAKVKNKKAPGTFDCAVMKRRKTASIVSAVVAAILVAVFGGYVALLMAAISHM